MSINGRYADFLEYIQEKPKCQTVVGRAHLSIFTHLVSVELLLNISVIQKFFKCKETIEVYVGGFKKYWAVEWRVPGSSPNVDKIWNVFWW